MYLLPTSNYLRRSLLVNHRRTFPPAANPLNTDQQIEQELQAVGATKFGLWKFASRYLPHVIHPQEHISGCVYGRNDQDGSVMLVATDRRVIYLDKKPLFINEEDVSYGVVSGIKYSSAGFGSTVTLHTRIKDFTIHTLNRKAARRFVAYIEERRLEQSEEDSYENT